MEAIKPQSGQQPNRDGNIIRFRGTQVWAQQCFGQLMFMMTIRRAGLESPRSLLITVRGCLPPSAIQVHH